MALVKDDSGCSVIWRGNILSVPTLEILLGKIETNVILLLAFWEDPYYVW